MEKKYKILDHLRCLLLFRKDITSFAGASNFDNVLNIKIERLKCPCELRSVNNLLDNLTIKSLLSKNSELIVTKVNKDIVGCFIVQHSGSSIIRRPFDFNFQIENGATYGVRIYVRNDFRRKGIATKMYEESFAIAKEQHKKYLDILIDYDNNPSLATSCKIGFQKKGAFLLIKLWKFNIVIGGKRQFFILSTTLIYRLCRKLIYVSSDFKTNIQNLYNRNVKAR